MNSQSTNGEGATMSSIPSFSQHRLNTEDQDGPSFLNRSGGGFYPDASSFSRSAKESVEELCRVWMNERNAPELLPYEHSLVEPLIASIISQTEALIETEASTANQFESMVYQTEIERIKYLIRNYLRTRLFKIEKYPLWILRQENLKELLSEQEINYARRYMDLTEQHNFDSFLLTLPRSQHKQDEEQEGSAESDMIVRPNFNAPVFCKVLTGDIGSVTMADGEDVFVEKDDLYILRYNIVRQFLRDNKVKLI